MKKTNQNLVLRKLYVSAETRKAVKVYAAENDLSIQQVVAQALNALYRQKQTRHYYASLTNRSPSQLVVRLPGSVVKKCTAKAEKDHISFLDYMYTAIVLYLEK